MDPVTVRAEDPVDKAAEIRRVVGVSTVPVVDEKGIVQGILGKDDYSMRKHQGQSVSSRMVPFGSLVFALWDDLQRKKDPLEAANDMLLEGHKGVLPVVDKDRKLVALVTRSDIEKNESFPLATKDGKKRLRVLAAVESYRAKALPRAAALDAFVDGFVIDTAHAFTQEVGELIKELKRQYPEKTCIAGNISTAEATRYLIKSGADAVKVGTGPGSICTTQAVTGTGRNQASAVYECAKAAHNYAGKDHPPIIADGGIKNGGDANLAIALGADAVMCGNLFAGTKEAPGDILDDDGVKKKVYRGMGSMEAMKAGSAVRYNGVNALDRVPEGVSKTIPYKGELSHWMGQVTQAMRQGFYKAGCKTVPELHKYAVLAMANKKEK